KTWLIGRRYPEESNVVRRDAEIYVQGNEEEKVSYGKQVALEETVKNLHEQVACLLCECDAKDRLMAEHAKTAQEALSGRERAEALVAIQKQELENVIQQKVAAIERLIHLNAALKKCRQELSSTKVEQDRQVLLEMAHKRLESKYKEAKKKLANLVIENARLTKALAKKEEIIENVNNQISKATAEFNALVSRFDSTERGNNVLKHEYGLLKKELKTKSRHAVTANRQQLETERQKLRMLVRKRAPGHLKNHSKATDRRISLLIKQLSEVEEENRILKESGCKREHEIQILKAELARVRLIIVKNLKPRDVVTEDVEQEEMVLQTGKKITEELTDHSSLHDVMTVDDGIKWEVVLSPPVIKEIINATETEEPRLLVPRALSIVPVKKRVKRVELLWRLLFRGKRGCSKKGLLCFAAYKKHRSAFRYPEESNVVRRDAEIYVQGNEEEKVSYGKQVALEETVKNLHEQVACLLCECDAKDRLMAEHAKTAQEALSGRERAEALVAIQKQELENVIQQKVAAIERLIHLNAALKKCRQELSSTKVEQDRQVRLEMAHKRLESKYKEAKKKLANLVIENARLTKALANKEEIIENVNNQISKATAEFNALVSRFDSTERGNNVLKHEYGLLKKELKIKSRHALTANRQQLETERQKLRMLVRKRAPGHPKNHSKAMDRRISLLLKQLSEVEEENRVLKESGCKREHEIQILKEELARIRRDEQNNGNSCMNEMNDHFENLRLVNFDLDQQLSAAQVELKEALHKTSFLEMELEDKSHHCQELEAACLELEFQLTSKDAFTEDVEQEETLLQTGKKITEELTNNKLTDQSSLHDVMTVDDGIKWEVVLSPPVIKEIINATETEEPRLLVPRALSIVPVKKRVKRVELLWRLLFRGKRGCSKKGLLCFAAYKVSGHLQASQIRNCETSVTSHKISCSQARPNTENAKP
ncbi:hypothetical protein M8C21_009265, partial [Ambrosia artemisiifolia]